MSNEKQIGDYILEDEIGAGGFAKVVKGTHMLTGEQVAIKVLDKNALREDPENFQRITKEIQILKLVKHKNIIKLYEVMETPQKIYLVMELCDGGELFDYIVSKERLSEDEACRFFQEIIDALDYLHSQNIVHRDIKPENMLLDKIKGVPTIKIIDFGISTSYSNDTLLTTPCGTANYAPPEMHKGEEYYGLLTDVWSAGIVLYSMVYGYLPFCEEEEEVNIKNIIAGDYDLEEDVSENVRDLIKHCMDIDPMNRYDITQIKEHPWFNLHQPAALSKGIIVGYNKIPIDERIINITAKFSFDKEKVRESVLNNKYDRFSSLYYIILKQMINQGYPSISDLFSEQYIKFMEDESNIIKKPSEEEETKTEENACQSPKQESKKEFETPKKTEKKKEEENNSFSDDSNDIDESMEPIGSKKPLSEASKKLVNKYSHRKSLCKVSDLHSILTIENTKYKALSVGQKRRMSQGFAMLTKNVGMFGTPVEKKQPKESDEVFNINKHINKMFKRMGSNIITEDDEEEEEDKKEALNKNIDNVIIEEKQDVNNEEEINSERENKGVNHPSTTLDGAKETTEREEEDLKEKDDNKNEEDKDNKGDNTPIEKMEEIINENVKEESKSENLPENKGVDENKDESKEKLKIEENESNKTEIQEETKEEIKDKKLGQNKDENIDNNMKDNKDEIIGDTKNVIKECNEVEIKEETINDNKENKKQEIIEPKKEETHEDNIEEKNEDINQKSKTETENKDDTKKVGKEEEIKEEVSEDKKEEIKEEVSEDKKDEIKEDKLEDKKTEEVLQVKKDEIKEDKLEDKKEENIEDKKQEEIPEDNKDKITEDKKEDKKQKEVTEVKKDEVDENKKGEDTKDKKEEVTEDKKKTEIIPENNKENSKEEIETDNTVIEDINKKDRNKEDENNEGKKEEEKKEESKDNELIEDIIKAKEQKASENKIEESNQNKEKESSNNPTNLQSEENKIEEQKAEEVIISDKKSIKDSEKEENKLNQKEEERNLNVPLINNEKTEQIIEIDNHEMEDKSKIPIKEEKEPSQKVEMKTEPEESKNKTVEKLLDDKLKSDQGTINKENKEEKTTPDKNIPEKIESEKIESDVKEETKKESKKNKSDEKKDIKKAKKEESKNIKDKVKNDIKKDSGKTKIENVNKEKAKKEGINNKEVGIKKGKQEENMQSSKEIKNVKRKEEEPKDKKKPIENVKDETKETKRKTETVNKPKKEEPKKVEKIEKKEDNNEIKKVDTSKKKDDKKKNVSSAKKEDNIVKDTPEKKNEIPKEDKAQKKKILPEKKKAKDVKKNEINKSNKSESKNDIKEKQIIKNENEKLEEKKEIENGLPDTNEDKKEIQEINSKEIKQISSEDIQINGKEENGSNTVNKDTAEVIEDKKEEEESKIHESKTCKTIETEKKAKDTKYEKSKNKTIENKYEIKDETKQHKIAKSDINQFVLSKNSSGIKPDSKNGKIIQQKDSSDKTPAKGSPQKKKNHNNNNLNSAFQNKPFKILEFIYKENEKKKKNKQLEASNIEGDKSNNKIGPYKKPLPHNIHALKLNENMTNANKNDHTMIRNRNASLELIGFKFEKEKQRKPLKKDGLNKNKKKNYKNKKENGFPENKIRRNETYNQINPRYRGHSVRNGQNKNKVQTLLKFKPNLFENLDEKSTQNINQQNENESFIIKKTSEKEINQDNIDKNNQKVISGQKEEDKMHKLISKIKLTDNRLYPFRLWRMKSKPLNEKNLIGKLISNIKTPDHRLMPFRLWRKKCQPKDEIQKLIASIKFNENRLMAFKLWRKKAQPITSNGIEEQKENNDELHVNICKTEESQNYSKKNSSNIKNNSEENPGSSRNKESQANGIETHNRRDNYSEADLFNYSNGITKFSDKKSLKLNIIDSNYNQTGRSIEHNNSLGDKMRLNTNSREGSIGYFSVNNTLTSPKSYAHLKYKKKHIKLQKPNNYFSQITSAKKKNNQKLLINNTNFNSEFKKRSIKTQINTSYNNSYKPNNFLSVLKNSNSVTFSGKDSNEIKDKKLTKISEFTPFMNGNNEIIQENINTQKNIENNPLQKEINILTQRFPLSFRDKLKQHSFTSKPFSQSSAHLGPILSNQVNEYHGAVDLSCIVIGKLKNIVKAITDMLDKSKISYGKTNQNKFLCSKNGDGFTIEVLSLPPSDIQDKNLFYILISKKQGDGCKEQFHLIEGIKKLNVDTS